MDLSYRVVRKGDAGGGFFEADSLNNAMQQAKLSGIGLDALESVKLIIRVEKRFGEYVFDIPATSKIITEAYTNEDVDDLWFLKIALKNISDETIYMHNELPESAVKPEEPAVKIEEVPIKVEGE